MEIFENLRKEIEKQTAGENSGTVIYCGNQILDIVNGNEAAAEIVLQDLKNSEMGVQKCEAKIRDFGKQKAKKNCWSVSDKEAEKIIRDFYGLPGTDEAQENAAPASAGIDLTAYL